MNPYEPPSTEPQRRFTFRERETRSICPICSASVNRLPLLQPVFRCKQCKRRLIIHSTARSTTFTTVTGGLLATLYVCLPVPVTERGTYLIGFVLVFVVSSTMYLHIFGTPRLKGWIGYASARRVRQEQARYKAESENA